MHIYRERERGRERNSDGFKYSFTHPLFCVIFLKKPGLRVLDSPRAFL